MKHNLIYNLLVNFWRLVMGSIFFYLANSLAIGLVLFVRLSWVSLPFYIVALILMFPAIGALADLLKGQKGTIDFISGLKQYYQLWRQNFKNYLKIGLLYSFILTFLLLDMYSVNVIMKSSLFTPVILILIMLVLISLGWIIAIQAYFKMDVRNTLKLMAYALPKYALNSLLIIALLFLLYMGLSFIPQILVFVIAPITIEGLNIVTKKPLAKVRTKLKLG